MTPDIEAIEARLAAITPVHWVAGIDIEPDDGGYWAGEDIIAVDQLPVPDYSRSDSTEEDSERVSAWADAHCREIIAQTHNYFSIPDEQHDANQRLIAHAPDDLRALVAEVRCLRGVLVGVDRLLTEVMDESNLHIFEPVAVTVTAVLAQRGGEGREQQVKHHE